MKRPGNFNAFAEYQRPRKGNWAHEMEMQLFSGGLAGNSKLGYSIQYEPTYFVSDALSLTAGIYADHTPDWLVWDRGIDLLGSYDAREVHLNAGLDWNIGNRQELRVKLQAIALDANTRQTYLVDGSGNAIASPVKVEDFSVSNLGFQIRYRYELAPLSYLYVVYGRGGTGRTITPKTRASCSATVSTCAMTSNCCKTVLPFRALNGADETFESAFR